VKSVKLPFIPELEIEFTERDRGIKQIYEFTERGTRFPIVVLRLSMLYSAELCIRVQN
jgi:hypothetical protein